MKNNILRLLIYTVCVFAVKFAFAEDIDKLNNCLGKLCLSDPRLSYLKAPKMLGSGDTKPRDGDLFTRVRCYRLQEHTTLILGYTSDNHDKDAALDAILLTTAPLCDAQSKSKLIGNNLSAFGDLSLGSNEESVLRHGIPNRIDPIEIRQRTVFGDRAVYFEAGGQSLLFNQFGITNGKVTSIWLNNSP